jgi:hypothetical protein
MRGANSLSPVGTAGACAAFAKAQRDGLAHAKMQPADLLRCYLQVTQRVPSVIQARWHTKHVNYAA